MKFSTKKLEIDKRIGEEQTDKLGTYRMINNKKVYQLPEDTEENKEKNLILNRLRLIGFEF